MKVLFIFTLLLAIMSPLFGDMYKLSPNLERRYTIFKKESGCKFYITSGYRTKAHNKRVGGSIRSFHLKGKALDLVPKKGCQKGKYELFELATKYFNGVIFYDDHIHIDIGNRRYHNIRSKE